MYSILKVEYGRVKSVVCDVLHFSSIEAAVDYCLTISDATAAYYPVYRGE